jgi:hypothetical protein
MLFGLLFMTMGPIWAVAVFANFGASDDAPGSRLLTTWAQIQASLCCSL